MKPLRSEKIGESLHLWFIQQRERGAPLSGPKKRHGTRQLTTCGEKLSARTNIIGDFARHFKKLIDEESYSIDQIYNCDEMGLNYKMMNISVKN
ncbi:hypothetical protein Trydic_g16020 [Trypoxylus dichotomus]